MIFPENILSRHPNSIIENNRVMVYSSVEEEYQVLKNGIGVKIVSEPVLIKLKNKDTIEFLHRISTNVINDLQSNQFRDTLFLNEKGRFIAKAEVMMLDGEVWLLSDEDPQARLFSWINKYIIMEDITTENCTGRYGLLELAGAQTESFLTLMIGNEVGGISTNDLKRFDVDGFTFYLFYQNGSSEKLFKIFLDATRIPEFINYLFSIKSVFDLSLVGELAFNRYRINKKIPAFPNELNSETNPHETNLIDMVNSKKGCYIGQEVIARLDTYDKVKRKLARLSIAGNYSGNSNIVVDAQGNEAGIITSFDNTNNPQEINALGLIKKQYLTSSNGLYLNDSSGKVPIRLIDKETA